MRFTLGVSALGSALFALLVAGVYEVTGGLVAVLATWALKLAIGAANICIGKAKHKHDSGKADRVVDRELALDAELEAAWRRHRPEHATHGDKRDFMRRMRAARESA